MRTEQVESLHVSVGYTCNNSCRFCMESDKEKRYRIVKGFIADGHMYDEMDRHSRLGMKKIGFGRGEPTLNPDLPKYVAYARKKGFTEIAVISNGRQYSDMDFCLKLIESGVTDFIVSLHGHTRELHESMTRGKNSFSETTNGLTNLTELRKRHTFRITISHVVNKVNYRFMGSFLSFMTRYAIDEVLLGVVRPYPWGGMKDFFPALMPRYRDVAEVLDRLLEDNPDLFLAREENGRKYVTINDLPICSSAKVTEYLGIRRDWTSGNDIPEEESHTDGLKKSHGPACAGCVYSRMCSGVFDTYTDHYGWDEFKTVKKA